MTTLDKLYSGSSHHDIELEGNIYGPLDEHYMFAWGADYQGTLLDNHRPDIVAPRRFELDMAMSLAGDLGLHYGETDVPWALSVLDWDISDRSGPRMDVESMSDAQIRLDRANRHFRRKVGAVFNDDDAVRLLAQMYSEMVVETSDFNFCEHGRSLAKLTAANFCEVGANGIYITGRGQRFIESLNTA